MKYNHLSHHPTIFQKCTGISVEEFDQVVKEVLPRYLEAENQRLQRPERERAVGAGHPFELEMRDHLLLTIVWLRLYPIHEVLGYLFGVSDSTVSRLIERSLPLLEQAGRDTMRLPDPGKKRRRQLSDLLHAIPELVLVVDSFEQRVQRPAHDNSHFSGKKKQNTLKSQVTVDGQSGRIVDTSSSVPGPTPDLTLLQQSHLLQHLPADYGVVGDLGYLGMDKLHPLAFIPRRKPRGKPRPAEDRPYNTAFAAFRVIVEHTIGRMRRFQCLSQTDRQHRRHHAARVAAVAGLVNRQPIFAAAA
jgi:DDE superfamily endonuclease/Helix-turn-helix of DDE superfamily endonuclease